MGDVLGRPHRVLLGYNAAGHTAGEVRTPSLREGASAGEGGSKREIWVPSCEKGRAGGLFRCSWGVKRVDALCLEMGKASQRKWRFFWAWRTSRKSAGTGKED